MHAVADLKAADLKAADLQASVSSLPLGTARRGFCGRIDAIAVNGHAVGLPAGELERRLLELGFVEGARVEILHEGMFGRDPIAVRVNEATIALRRREAMAILVS
ncbi:FeoA family protein [Rhodoplanes azumiensis]|uniref:Ferrous iron transport protein A n=1 Tax=Rhodoplanes azumiensis TaxID=1897628 RepID=A0ABW5AHI1_9BRAD